MRNTPSMEGRVLLLQEPGFRWLLLGSSVSLLGDQFTLLALPWLVLSLTKDTLILGLVLAFAGVPRVILILFGGALTDRYSPKRVLMATKCVNTVLLGLFAILVVMGALRFWMVYGFAIGIGLASAFSFPSGSAICSQVVESKRLQTANSILMSMRQISMLAGPLLAGLLVAFFGGGGTNHPSGEKGLGLAFAFDAFSFAFSAWTLTKVPVNSVENSHPGPSGKPVLHAIMGGLRHFWKDKSLRAFCLFAGAVNFFISGPLQVGLPVLASAYLGHSASTFGAWMSFYGTGTLAGMAISGALPESGEGQLGMMALLINGLTGLLLLPIGLVRAPWQCSILLGVIGLLGGFIKTAFFTWIQRRVPVEMLGRAMSLFMFIYMGLTPVSAAMTGWLMRGVNVSRFFTLCGWSLIGIVITGWVTPNLRDISADGTQRDT